MTGLPITLTFTFDDMAQAERAIAAVRRAITDTPETAFEKVGGVASSCSAFAAVSEITERRELDVNASKNGVTSPGGENPATLSELDGDAIAAVKGPARPASVVDAEPSPSSTILPTTKPLRPHCRNLNQCASGTRDHCWTCRRLIASAESEAA